MDDPLIAVRRSVREAERTAHALFVRQRLDHIRSTVGPKYPIWYPDGASDTRNGGANVQSQTNSKWRPHQNGGVLHVFLSYDAVGGVLRPHWILFLPFKDSCGDTSRFLWLKGQLS